MDLTNKQRNYFRSIHKVLLAGHRLTDLVSQALKPHQISEPQYNVLRILASHPDEPICMQDLQQQMIQRSSNVTRIVDKLYHKGLVSRKVCPENRRRMDLRLTDAGGMLLRELDQLVHEVHAPFMAALSTDEILQLSQLLSKLKIES